MAPVDLTSSQKTVLTALTDLYRQIQDPVRGEDIAEQIDRNPGTVRNQMQTLKSLQLVEGVTGPDGGYKPTAEAYDALGVERIDDPADVPVIHDSEAVEDVNIEDIDLSNVHHPGLCRAEIRIRGSMRDFEEGDEISVGPTPLNDLRLTGTVDGKDETSTILLLRVEEMLAPADEPTD